MDFSRSNPATRTWSSPKPFPMLIAWSCLSVSRAGATGRTRGWQLRGLDLGRGEALPAPSIALAAKGLGPFPLPKLGRTAVQFWAFKSSAGNAPTTAALALQLYVMPVYDQWFATLRRRAPAYQICQCTWMTSKSQAEQDLMSALRAPSSTIPNSANGSNASWNRPRFSEVNAMSRT